MKKAIQIVRDNRDYLLRFLDTSAEGDRYMITHAVNTTILALAIGDYLKSPPHRLIELGNACILHEIGMLKLPAEVQRSSKSLSPEERKAMMAHTLLGYRILKGFSAPENVALAALEHHERIDGTGYPRSLSAPKITDYALIISVVCAYDAMVSRRPFRLGSLDGHATIRDLAQKNRKQYDEKILKALVYTLSVYPVGTAVQLSNSSKGLVVKTDPAKPRCPIVKVVFDPDGKKLVDPPQIQVSDTDGLTITGVLSAGRSEGSQGIAVNVRVSFPGGETREFPAGTRVREVARHPSFPRTNLPVVAALVNNEVVSLQHPLSVNCSVAAVDLGSRQGLAIYRRSLCFLLSLSATRIFPRKRLVVGHSLGQGYFYYFDGTDAVSRDELARIEAEMRGIVARDLPIGALSLSYQEAIAYFQKHNQPDTLLLLKNRNDPAVAVNSCDGFPRSEPRASCSLHRPAVRVQHHGVRRRAFSCAIPRRRIRCASGHSWRTPCSSPSTGSTRTGARSCASDPWEGSTS